MSCSDYGLSAFTLSVVHMMTNFSYDFYFILLFFFFYLNFFVSFFKFFILFYFLTLQYCIGFAIYQHETPQVYTCSPSWTLLPPPSPYHPSGSSPCTSPKHPVTSPGSMHDTLSFFLQHLMIRLMPPLLHQHYSH